jgi:hypothetical protein
MSNWIGACDLIKADESSAPKIGMEAPQAAPSLANLKAGFKGVKTSLDGIHNEAQKSAPHLVNALKAATRTFDSHRQALHRLTSKLGKSSHWNAACDLCKSK